MSTAKHMKLNVMNTLQFWMPLIKKDCRHLTAARLAYALPAGQKSSKEKTHMDEREGLSDAEVDEGYILTCQAHIRSSEVEVIYE